ncbi:MAG: DNA polymerase III subunit alpha [Gammaproteobacteria bacterium]|nr:DNA polymerase III subunit alpha [Gammaproteobacteria bacterium]OUT96998.1 MAG: DNA polymerase III subunit alpha [Gammaproteobacteria bacterium TMED36]
MNNPSFVHLDVNTEYTLGRSTIRQDQLIDACIEMGMPAFGVTEHNNLFSAYKLYKSSQKKGVKYIIGSTVTIFDKKERTKSKLSLLCENEVGYKNLCALITQSYTKGLKNNEPVIDSKWLDGQTEGLIAISSYNSGYFQQSKSSDLTISSEKVITLQKLFPERLFISISRMGIAHEEKINQSMIDLSSNCNIPIVAVNNPIFIEKDDFISLDARVCIDQGTILEDERRSKDYTSEQYFKSSVEMADLFADIPEALSNTIVIAEMCNFGFGNTEHVLPDFKTPDEYSIDEYLEQESKKGLQKILSDDIENHTAYKKRLGDEIKIIKKTGFAGYFLIVADFVKWSRDQNIPVGPGRGSGPGSLVAYSLGITDIDPIEHDLIFERFLNPERISMPDFDIDFCVNGRDRVIDYVNEKYGDEKVSQIITYGTLSARAVVRDVGRILGYPYGMVDRVAKMIPFEIGITLNDALKKSNELAEKYEEDDDIQAIIDLSLNLEGLVRNAGTHAGGVVIAPSNLSDFMPLFKVDDEEGTVTQFDKDDAESIGLIKFDFLGLKTLTVIQNTVELINFSADSPINIKDILLDDKVTYKLLSSARTIGIFQLESPGMRDLIERMQPSRFEDIVALVALFRPGPLQSGMVDDFIERKKGGEAKIIDYLHPSLEPILRPTYGVIVYQEQVMQIAQKLSNYTQGSADILRKAMGKKIPEEMAKQKDIFIQGAIENSIPEASARRIFELIEKFAGYGFNKSHSVSYALIAYQTAYLKAHYPTEFFAASLTYDMENTDKLIRIKEDCESFEIEVKPPCINHSAYEFSVWKQDEIRYALGAIKGIGRSISEAIYKERKQNGEFKTIFDFCSRLSSEKPSKRTLEALVKCGAMDAFGENRSTLLNSIQIALSYSNKLNHEQSAGQTNLFYSENDEDRNLPDLRRKRELQVDEKLGFEYATLGFYFSGHPFDAYRNDCKHFTRYNISSLKRMLDSKKRESYGNNNSVIDLAGLVSDVKRRGNNLAFKIDDGTAMIEGIVFGEKMESLKGFIMNNQLLFLRGKLRFDSYADMWQLVIEEATPLEEMISNKAKKLVIRCDPNFNPKKLQNILKPHTPGNCSVQLNYLSDVSQTKMKFSDEWKVNPTKQLRETLAEELGIDNFQFISS